MIYQETEILPFNPKNQEYKEIITSIELSPFLIEERIYNIPPKILDINYKLDQIHMYYRSEEYKVIISQEKDDYPARLTESIDTPKNYNNDQLIIPISFSSIGKGYVRISLYRIGIPNPIKIDKFKFLNNNDTCITYGYNFPLKAGQYFLLLDNVKVDLDIFNKYESIIGEDANNKIKWRGSESFKPTFCLSNKMCVLPFIVGKE